jgi:O-acetyl-ADP-ribose deacetylase (regulator of RNase III)
MSSLKAIRPMVAAKTETDPFRDYSGKPMLIYRRTSLFESTAQTLVNTVNCVGVMGKGIAKAFKEREPEMFAAYRRICDQKLLEPGKLWLWRGANSWTLNFPTKKHWKHPSKIEWIEAGLKKFVDTYQSLGITEISFPLLGCGNGGLDWNDVRPVMERHLQSLPIPVFIHDHTVDIGLPEHMESVAQQLKAELADEVSFELFLSAIHRVVELAGHDLVEIDTKKSISASIVDENVLKIESDNASWNFEREDLWGAWVGLQKGLLTKEKAAWSREGAGTPLLSFLSVLPNVRPVQIQGVNSDPEIALEYRPGERGNVIVPSEKPQLELAWH